jgi:hypothetical protein
LHPIAPTTIFEATPAAHCEAERTPEEEIMPPNDILGDSADGHLQGSQDIKDGTICFLFKIDMIGVHLVPGYLPREIIFFIMPSQI